MEQYSQIYCNCKSFQCNCSVGIELDLNFEGTVVQIQAGILSFESELIWNVWLPIMSLSLSGLYTIGNKCNGWVEQDLCVPNLCPPFDVDKDQVRYTSVQGLTFTNACTTSEELSVRVKMSFICTHPPNTLPHTLAKPKSLTPSYALSMTSKSWHTSAIVSPFYVLQNSNVPKIYLSHFIQSDSKISVI